MKTKKTKLGQGLIKSLKEMVKLEKMKKEFKKEDKILKKIQKSLKNNFKRGKEAPDFVKEALIKMINEAFKELKPLKISINEKNKEIMEIMVVSDVFEGTTFSERFKILNDLLNKNNPKMFKERVYVFKAFTSKDVSSLKKISKDKIKKAKKAISKMKSLKKESIKAIAPIYDEVYEKGVKALDSLDSSFKFKVDLKKEKPLKNKK